MDIQVGNRLHALACCILRDRDRNRERESNYVTLGVVLNPFHSCDIKYAVLRENGVLKMRFSFQNLVTTGRYSDHDTAWWQCRHRHWLSRVDPVGSLTGAILNQMKVESTLNTSFLKSASRIILPGTTGILWESNLNPHTHTHTHTYKHTELCVCVRISSWTVQGRRWGRDIYIYIYFYIYIYIFFIYFMTPF